MHSRRMFLALGAAASLAALVMSPPAEARAVAGLDVIPIAGDAILSIRGAGPGVDGDYHLALHPEEIAFVDGLYVVPGGEQLRVFYRDQVYAPKGLTARVMPRYAAMQPDNGAGQVSGDRAQSVGKAGDLKAARPTGVKSETPGAKTIDASKQSWLRRIGPWLFRQPLPS